MTAHIVRDERIVSDEGIVPCVVPSVVEGLPRDVMIVALPRQARDDR
jgi:hypothetical protein